MYISRSPVGKKEAVTDVGIGVNLILLKKEATCVTGVQVGTMIIIKNETNPELGPLRAVTKGEINQDHLVRIDTTSKVGHNCQTDK